MARRKRKAGGKEIDKVTILFAAVFIVFAFSLAVRWAGVRPGPPAKESPIQIEVLNGTGEPGIARTTTLELRKMGIDVLIEGNASRFDFRETLLIDRRGNPEMVNKLARRIGCRRVLAQIQDRPEVDATLVLGWDREHLNIGD